MGFHLADSARPFRRLIQLFLNSYLSYVMLAKDRLVVHVILDLQYIVGWVLQEESRVLQPGAGEAAARLLIEA